MRMKTGGVVKFEDEVDTLRPQEEHADEAMRLETLVHTTLPCGLDDFEDVGADATFGDGKTFFVARCRATSDPEVCGAIASLIWEKQDLSAAFTPAEDSVFCTALSSVVRSNGDSGFKSPLLPEVSSLLSSLDETVGSWRRRNRRRTLFTRRRNRRRSEITTTTTTTTTTIATSTEVCDDLSGGYANKNNAAYTLTQDGCSGQADSDEKSWTYDVSGTETTWIGSSGVSFVGTISGSAGSYQIVFSWFTLFQQQ